MNPTRDALESFLSSPISRFTPWHVDGTSPQAEFIKAAADYDIRIFRSGNRCGKTTIVIFDALLHLLGWHPHSKHKGPQRWWFSGLDWDFGIGQVIWPVIQEFLPMDMVRTITWRRKTIPQLPLSIQLKNGSIMEFKSADGGARKYQGAKLHGCVADEEHEEDVIEEIRARLIDYSGYLSLSLTPVRRLKWIKKLEQQPYVFTVRTSMMDAARAGVIPMKQVERYAAELPEKQRRVRVYGDFVTVEGMVYPNFSHEKHIAKPLHGSLVCQDTEVAPWPIPQEWPRYASMDFGFDKPSSVLLAAHDTKNGRLIVYRNFYASNIRNYVWAKHLQRLLPRNMGLPVICDHDAQGRAELEAQGIKTALAFKGIDAGIELVERLMEPGKDGIPKLIFVHDEYNDPYLGRADAIHLTREIENYHYAKPRSENSPDRPDRPVKRDDHACDSLRYMVCSVVGLSGRQGGNLSYRSIVPGW